MFKKNVTEIIIKPQTLNLEEFDISLQVDDVFKSLNDSGHSSEFLAEIKDGLGNSSIYKKNES